LALPEELRREEFRFNVVPSEEAARAGVPFDSVQVHMDIVVPYFDRYGTRDQVALIPDQGAVEEFATVPSPIANPAQIASVHIRRHDHASATSSTNTNMPHDSADEFFGNRAFDRPRPYRNELRR
jgi:hypothetical protein